jgi:cell wall-associated NlpC family hydrolase
MIRPIDEPSIVEPRPVGLVGIPYRPRGLGLDGLDCYGFMVLALRRAGEIIPDDPGEFGNIVKYRDRGKMLQYPCELKPWDILFFNKGDSELVTHTGLCLDEGREMIHCDYYMGGVVIQPIRNCHRTLRSVVRLNRFS